MITLVIALAIHTIKAQNLRLGYFQQEHMFILNPAEVIHDQEQVFLEYGRKWADLTYSPEALQVGGVFHSSEKLSFGGVINRNTSGIYNLFHFGISTGYKVNLSDRQTLSAGLAPYIKNNIIDLSDVVANMNDPLLSGEQYNKTHFGMGIGLSYTYDNFKAHLSIPETHDVEIGDEGFGSFITGGASYDFFLDDFLLTPYVTYIGTPIDQVVEGLFMASWKETLKFGAGYRSNKTFSFRVEFQSGSIALGYALANTSGNFSSVGISNNFSVRYIFKRATVDTKAKINSLVSTNERILSRMDAEENYNRNKQEEILQRLDELTHQQDTVQNLQRDFIEKFEESERKNTIDQNTDKEVEPGYYLIIYSFHDSTELNKIKEELVSLPFETRLIRDKEKSFYYISTRRYDTLEMAVIGMQNIRNQGFEEAWIHWYK